MTIEGLGKKFQEARLARKLTLEEAARMTKIRPSRLAEIETDDFSQFPSLAYAKGFLLIYGKFLDVDVTPYLEAFEGSQHVTVDGYSYLQEAPAPKPPRAPVIGVQRKQRISPWPLLVGLGVVVLGFFIMKLVVNLNRLKPATYVGIPETPASALPESANLPTIPAAPPPATALAKQSKREAPLPIEPARAAASSTAGPLVAPPASPEPEVRKAEPVGSENLATEGAAAAGETQSENRVDIKPLKSTYLKVVVDNGATAPTYERWISPSDGTVEFRGQKIAVRVLNRDAIQVKKNGKLVTESDSDLTIQ